MATDKKIKYEDQRLTKKVKPAKQGGGMNYLGKQETVTVPKKWLSDPDHVVAELAYITPREQKILLDANIYGSLKGKPNKGPGGIMSLQGDLGGYDASPGGPNDSGGGGGGNRVGQADKNKQAIQDILKGNVTTGQTVAVSDRVRRGALPEIAYGPDGKPKYIGSAKKFVGQSLFNPSGYRDISNKTGGFFGFGGRQDIQFNPVTGQYEFEEEETGDVKPGMGGRILGGLASLVTGIPFVGSAIGGAIDRYKPKSYFDKLDPKELQRLNSLSLTNPIDQKVYNPGEDVSMVINDPFAKTLFADNTQPPNVGSMGQVIPQDNRITQSVTEGPYSTGGLDSYLEDDLTTNQGIVNTNAFTNSNFGLGNYYDG